MSEIIDRTRQTEMDIDATMDAHGTLFGEEPPVDEQTWNKMLSQMSAERAAQAERDNVAAIFDK